MRQEFVQPEVRILLENDYMDPFFAGFVLEAEVILNMHFNYFAFTKSGRTIY